MKSCFEIGTSGKRGKRILAVALCAVPLSMPPVLAGAVETDRITVEDPSTGAVKFKVTSEGNVSAAQYAGDGAQLSNVAHWKGTWNSATSYAKDDCVFYGGSSWIAQQASSNAQPDLAPASWAVMAQQGPAGAVGATGPQGATGATGPQGPAGSPDTQADILGKLATPADNASLTLQQGPLEAGTSSKILVKDNTGAGKFVIQPNGAMGIGTGQASFPVTIDSSIGLGVPAGVGTVMLLGNSNKERIELRSYGPTANCTIQGKSYRTANNLPAATAANQTLFSVGGSGHDGNDIVVSNKIFIDFRAAENWTPTTQGTYFVLHTTTSGTTTRSERLRVNGDGNVGVGSAAPTQKLEVNGGIRINTTVAKPVCNSNARGTLWYTQGSPDDIVEICANVNGVLTWKPLW